MIVQEFLTINGKPFIKTYSDENRHILQNETGIEYTEAIDLADVSYTYSETDKLIEEEEGEPND